jgi:hypothetical protein
MSDPTPTDPAELRAEIAQTRADLGDTVEALAAKTDVSGRARQAASDAAHAAVDRIRSEVDVVADDPVAAVRRPFPLAVLAVGAALTGLVIYLFRRLRS